MKTKNNKILFFEIVSAFGFFAVAICLYIHLVLHGIGPGDEGFYFTIPYRLLLGDGLIVDEWNLSQFSSIITYLPLKAFCSVTGSTDGIILFFRFCYIISLMMTGAFVLFSLSRFSQREYGRTGSRLLFYVFSLCAVAVFFSYIPATIPTLNYYTFSIMGLACLICLLFCYENKNPLRNIAAGLVFGMIVFVQPGCVIPGLLFVIYTAATAVAAAVGKKKELPPFITGNIAPNCLIIAVWAACGLIVLIVICTKEGVMDVFRSIPRLLDDPEHALRFQDSAIKHWRFYLEAFTMYGKTNLILLAVLTALSAILRKYRNRTRPFFLSAYAIVLLLIYLSVWKYVDSNQSIQAAVTRHGLPLYLSGPFFALISQKINTKLLGMWLTCACFSLIYSLTSNSIVFAGGIVAGMVSLLLLGDLLISITKNHDRTVGRHVIVIATTAAVFVSVAFEFQYFAYQWKHPICESELSCAAPEIIDTVIPSGPHQGIMTSSRIANFYSCLLEDIRYIDSISDEGDHLLVAGLEPWLYLATGINCASFSSWYSNQYLPRLLTWWELHPDKKPDYIYYSYIDIYTFDQETSRKYKEAVLDSYASCFDFERIEGQAGVILKIIDSHTAGSNR